MGDNIVNQITLDCLINKDKIEKHKSMEKNMKINKKDKKFYRRRVLNLTRELLLSKKENITNNNCESNDINYISETTVTPDLLNAFNNYLKACINNFKIIDKNDIIQEDYKDMVLDMNYLNDIIETDDMKNNNENNNDNNDNNGTRLFMRSIKTSKHNLDNFVKYNYKKQEEEIILPKIREINLSKPTLRNKGIKKKENINIFYDENKEK
jgi:hypothetical protein